LEKVKLASIVILQRVKPLPCQIFHMITISRAHGLTAFVRSEIQSLAKWPKLLASRFKKLWFNKKQMIGSVDNGIILEPESECADKNSQGH